MIQGTTSQVQEIRDAFHMMQIATRRRALGRQGHSQIKKLVTIELLSRYRLDGTMTMMIAKLLLPRSIWEVCDLLAGRTRAEHLRRLITHPKII